MQITNTIFNPTINTALNQINNSVNQLNQINKMDIENEYLKKALNVVSISLNHEVNNALTPIFFMSNFFKNKTDDPDLKAALEIILLAAKKIQNTVTSINNLQKADVIPTTQYLEGITMLDIGN
ncbi:MAG: hypothetical protein DKM50_12580 [Candidatus Margulisiibacteriota bacterium]|nr:MAG: hypothetical protein A2X43_11040 [Candidatus Margulisbacteria bacterium GWD2_39_127]OGI02764.1 MAG: hypothetical protein A2X42_01865 [Candidatus Margulisbacteria bacterium GWF2_38_17]OGI09349.1 MAG: hypothetical protein A2X41_09510 [Candidatus Margulisbacteria bacterium GWE2_39_32]PZM77437.1 MAG: hypothetical protein DKM50_12580 [Candidatus Margulisiibacteriota bacterium]HAR64000.1 hypothetical protein [Candidatus Margulisiibacteriota bacterium]